MTILCIDEIGFFTDNMQKGSRYPVYDTCIAEVCSCSLNPHDCLIERDRTCISGGQINKLYRQGLSAVFESDTIDSQKGTRHDLSRVMLPPVHRSKILLKEKDDMGLRMI